MEAETKALAKSAAAGANCDGAAAASAAYKRIQDGLRRRLAEGAWPVGAMLPGRRDLAREYGVSTFTVERAISGLVAEGMLRTDDRRGTFVTQTSNAGPLLPEPGYAAPRTLPVPRSPILAVPGPTQKVGALSIGIIASLYPAREDHLALNNTWVRLFVEAIEHAFAEEGEMTRFFNRVVNGGGDKPLLPMATAVASALSADIDALVVIGYGPEPRELDESLAALEGHDLPVVCISSGALVRPIPHVFVDNQGGGYQAAQHLLQQGVRRLLYLAPFTATWSQERLAGVRAAAAHAGMADDKILVFPKDVPPWVNEKDPEVLGYDAGKAVFEGGFAPKGTGVVCVNDGVAFGFLHAAAEAGRMAGHDFLLIGFDDHPDSRARNLTTLRKPIQSMGMEAARLLRQSLRHELESLQVRLRWRLIPRASTQSLSGDSSGIPEG